MNGWPELPNTRGLAYDALTNMVSDQVSVAAGLKALESKLNQEATDYAAAVG